MSYPSSLSQSSTVTRTCWLNKVLHFVISKFHIKQTFKHVTRSSSSTCFIEKNMELMENTANIVRMRAPKRMVDSAQQTLRPPVDEKSFIFLLAEFLFQWNAKIANQSSDQIVTRLWLSTAIADLTSIFFTSLSYSLLVSHHPPIWLSNVHQFTIFAALFKYHTSVIRCWDLIQFAERSNFYFIWILPPTAGQRTKFCCGRA